MKPQIARIFKNGRSQAVRLPKEYRFEGNEVFIRKEGNDMILSPLPKSWDSFFKETPLPSEDFLPGRGEEISATEGKGKGTAQ
jgi:antitoxin VapB